MPTFHHVRSKRCQSCNNSRIGRGATPLCRRRSPYFTPSLPQRFSDQAYPISLETLLAVDHLDPHPLSRIKGVDATAAQRGDVDEHVLAAAVGRNEAVALFGREPFHRA